MPGVWLLPETNTTQKVALEPTEKAKWPLPAKGAWLSTEAGPREPAEGSQPAFEKPKKDDLWEKWG